MKFDNVNVTLFVFILACDYYSTHKSVHGIKISSGPSSGRRTLEYCPTGWVRYRHRKCFKVFTNNLNHKKAELSCEQHDGTLASLSSPQDHEFLKTFIQKEIPSQNLNDVWLGGKRFGTIWFWSDLSPFLYNYWHMGHPDPKGSCVWLTTNSNTYKNRLHDWGKMGSRDCGDSLNYICQKFQLDSRIFKYECQDELTFDHGYWQWQEDHRSVFDLFGSSYDVDHQLISCRNYSTTRIISFPRVQATEQMCYEFD